MKKSKTTSLKTLIAHAIADSNTSLALNVPGWGGTEVIETLQTEFPKLNSHICFNEEAAFSIASGAALFGKRACLLIKAHGLLKAANALTSTLSIGTNQAFVIFVFDDTKGKSSDNILNTLPYLQSLEAPYFHLGENPYEMIQRAYQTSESLRLPVIIYVECDKLESNYTFEIESMAESRIANRPWTPYESVAAPLITKFQRDILVSKLNQKNWTNAEPPSIPNIGDILPPKLKFTYDKYRPFFDVFQHIEKDFVSGDAGTSSLFAFPPYECIKFTSYMGGSPGLAAGASLAGAKKSWSVTGDFSFLAAGILGWQECLSLEIPIKLIIFQNHYASATGGQKIPEILLQKFCKANEELIQTIAISDSSKRISDQLIRLSQNNKLAALIVKC